MSYIFIDLHSAGGATVVHHNTVVRMERNYPHTTHRARTLNVTCFRAVSTVH